MACSPESSTPPASSGEGGDHRKGPRRRGEALYRAIFEATLAELEEVGYARLTMERIAERARTGKASLYRRWPSRVELVIDATRWALPDRDELPDTGDLREDVFSLLRLIADRLAGPIGEAARGLLSEALNDPDLSRVARARMAEGLPLMLEILRRGAERGDARPEALTPLVASVGPALLRHHFLANGAPISDEVLWDIVDDVVLPLVAVRSPDRHPSGTRHAAP